MDADPAEYVLSFEKTKRAARRQSMSCGFSVEDYLGRPIRLEHANWEKHRPRHPKVVRYHDAIPLAVADPHLVIDLGDQRHYYRFGIGRDKLENAALRVVVGCNDGIIRTVHFARRIDFRRGTVVLDRLEQIADDNES